MDRAQVSRWLDDYVRAWESYSPEAIGALFSENATYSHQPFDAEALRGRAAIVEAWLAHRDPPGTYEAHYEPIAVDGDIAVANGRSRYYKDSTRAELDSQWDNIFVLRFDADGRCASFQEWYMAPPGQTSS